MLARSLRAPGDARNPMVFVDGLAAYLQAYLSALLAALWSTLPFNPRPGEGLEPALEPLSLRRALFLLLFPLFLLVQLIHILCLALDHLLFPAFRSTKLSSPIFVVGVPRSGTTYLHRELAQDSAFTAPRTWELLFAPSLCQRYLVGALAGFDRVFGSPVSRALRVFVAREMREINEVHPVGLNAAEEDYLALLPGGGCFFAAMAFPASKRFRGLAGLDGLSPVQRRRVLDHYHGLLQRQVYFHGNKQLLSKNAAFAAWTPFIAARYPDAKILMCIRNPSTALASQLSSLKGARDAFGTFPRDADLEDRFRDHYTHWWHSLARGLEDIEPTPLVIEQEWLRHNREAALALIYRYLRREQPPIPARDDGSSPQSGAGASTAARKAGWSISGDSVAAMQSPYAALRVAARSEREMAS